MVAELPPADPASSWMKHLERAHHLAHAAARSIEQESDPNLHLAPAARHVEGGVTAMYDAFDGRADRRKALNVAHGRLWEAAILAARAGMPRAVDALREACRELISAEERFPRVPLDSRAEAELKAGGDVPPLHTIERASLSPLFRAPPVPERGEEAPAPALPAPKTFEELAAVAEMARRLAQKRPSKSATSALSPAAEEPAAAKLDPPRGFAEIPPAPIDEETFIRRWARECFEEIGMLGAQRSPLPGDAWRTSIDLERRLIRAVDAIAALGPTAIAHIEPLALDAPVANPMSVFAAALLGGCLEGRDALAAAERVLYRFGPNDPVVAAPFASAMKLAPNPFVESAMRSLQASAELGCRALAIEVLTCRHWLDADELAALADDDDPRVLALALPALATARHRDLDRALARALAHTDLQVQAAALDAMALAAHPQATSAARSAAAGALGEQALVRLALVADEDSARWLLQQMRTTEAPEAIAAVGWAGLVEAIPALLKLLESESEEVALAAAAALERMLGANLIESIEIPSEALEEIDIADPDPEPHPLRRSLDALVSHPRDPAPSGSPETLEVPTRDPAKWRAYWATHGRRQDPKQRLRRGNPYAPSVSLYELDQLPLSPEDRRRLHRELSARTGKITHFDPHDFVVIQEQSLASWGALLRASAEAPGSWGRPNAR